MDRCPACRARFAGSPVCPRCGGDFTLACAAETQARQLGREALRLWLEGDSQTAGARAEESLRLHYSDLTATMLRAFGNAARDR